MRDVTTPTGTSCGSITVRAAVSTHTRKMAPASAVTGRRRAWPDPVRARVACGRTRPTKPMAPAELTRVAVSSAVAHSRTRRVRATRTPSAAAASSPKAKASRVRACPRQTRRTAARTTAHSSTSLQPAPVSEPRSQNSTARVVSASAEVSTVNEVSAENSCMAATPDSTTRSVLPPRLWLSARTRPKESSAPMNAPADRDTAPPPTPRTTTATAPVEAPEDTPRTKGSASGLRSRDCITAPQSASPAPHTAASRVRGMRRFHTMPSRSGGNVLSPRPRWAVTAAQTSAVEMSAGPMVTAKAIDAKSAASPPAISSRRRVLTWRVRSGAARRRPARPLRRCGWTGSWPARSAGGTASSSRR
ncbi:hypothetical protein SANTM175S_00705 [Streptomyces antimycoticus]